jgi:tRNA(Ile)-lysidine synthase TilS/MesJ
MEAYRLFLELVGNDGSVAPAVPAARTRDISCEAQQGGVIKFTNKKTGTHIVCITDPAYCTPLSTVQRFKQQGNINTREQDTNHTQQRLDEELIRERLREIEKEELQEAGLSPELAEMIASEDMDIDEEEQP